MQTAAAMQQGVNVHCPVLRKLYAWSACWLGSSYTACQ